MAIRSHIKKDGQPPLVLSITWMYRASVPARTIPIPLPVFWISPDSRNGKKYRRIRQHRRAVTAAVLLPVAVPAAEAPIQIRTITVPREIPHPVRTRIVLIRVLIRAIQQIPERQITAATAHPEPRPVQDLHREAVQAVLPRTKTQSVRQ